MKALKKAALALTALTAASPAFAIPIVYEFTTVTRATTRYNTFLYEMDRQYARPVGGAEESFRIAFDTDVATTGLGEPWGQYRQPWRPFPLPGFERDFFQTELQSGFIDGAWLQDSVQGVGADFTVCSSVWTCSGLSFGRYTFFSNVLHVADWFDASTENGMVAGRDYYYCNIQECDFGGSGVITSIRQVPEPATLALFGVGLVGLLVSKRRKTAPSRPDPSTC